MKEIKYTKDHEWVKIEGTDAYVGITDFAQQQLGDVVFIQLPEIGLKCKTGSEVAVIESVKAASEIYAPLSGAISDVNNKLNDSPEIINSDAENAGWIWKMSIDELEELNNLMDEVKYSSYIDENS